MGDWNDLVNELEDDPAHEAPIAIGNKQEDASATTDWNDLVSEPTIATTVSKATTTNAEVVATVDPFTIPHYKDFYDYALAYESSYSDSFRSSHGSVTHMNPGNNTVSSSIVQFVNHSAATNSAARQILTVLEAKESRPALYRGWLQFLETEIYTTKREQALILSLQWFIHHYNRYGLIEDAVYGERIRLFVVLDTLRQAHVPERIAPLLNACLAMQPINDFIQVTQVDMALWFKARQRKPHVERSKNEFVQAVHMLIFQQPDAYSELRLKGLISAHRTRSDAYLSLMTTVIAIVFAQHIVSDSSRKIFWCLNATISNLNQSPPSAPTLSVLAQNIAVLVPVKSEFDYQIEQVIDLLKDRFGRMLELERSSGGMHMPKYDVKDVSHKDHAHMPNAKPKKPRSEEGLSDDLVRRAPHTSRYHRDGYMSIAQAHPSVLIARIDDVWMEVDPILSASKTLLASVSKGTLMFTLQQLVWAIDGDDGRKDPALVVPYEKLNQFCTGFTALDPDGAIGVSSSGSGGGGNSGGGAEEDAAGKDRDKDKDKDKDKDEKRDKSISSSTDSLSAPDRGASRRSYSFGNLKALDADHPISRKHANSLIGKTMGLGQIPSGYDGKLYYISIHSQEVFYFFPFTEGEITQLQNMLADVTGKDCVPEDRFFRDISEQRVSSQRMAVLRELSQQQGTWVEDMPTLIGLIQSLTETKLKPDPDVYMYELERLFHSCRLNEEVTRETVLILKDLWEKSAEQALLRILTIVDRLLDRALMHIGSTSFTLLSNWLHQIEYNINPYKNPRLLTIVSQLKQRMKVLQRQTLIPISNLQLETYSSKVV